MTRQGEHAEKAVKDATQVNYLKVELRAIKPVAVGVLTSANSKADFAGKALTRLAKPSY